MRRRLPLLEAAAYAAAQLAGGIVGTWIAHLMFGLPVFQVATIDRGGLPLALSEGIATFGLLLTMLGCAARAPAAAPFAVGLYITAAYWFTASTSFANPAVTVARAMTATFSGIAAENVTAFVVAQMAGMALALAAAAVLWPGKNEA